MEKDKGSESFSDCAVSWSSLAILSADSDVLK
jgi:hypothetical protein